MGPVRCDRVARCVRVTSAGKRVMLCAKCDRTIGHIVGQSVPVVSVSVKAFREAGLEAKWGKTGRGTPVMFVRDPNASTNHQRVTWWMCDRGMWEAMNRQGIKEGFNACTLLGDLFSLKLVDSTGTRVR
jgi:hypothetical protein